MTTPTDLREQAAAAVRQLRERNGGVFLVPDNLATLIDQLASALPVWRPISEAPKDIARHMLLSDGKHVGEGAFVFVPWGPSGFQFIEPRQNLIGSAPIAWMPLPQSEPVPEDKEKA